MTDTYFIIIPGHICDKICNIGGHKIQNLYLPNCSELVDSKIVGLLHKGLLLNTEMKNGIFSFIIYDSSKPRDETIANINKIMTVFFYCILANNTDNGGNIYENSLLTYYICSEPDEFPYEDDKFVTFHYRFNGVKMQNSSFLCKEKIKQISNVPAEFDSGYLKYYDKYNSYSLQEIKAMDRFVAARRSQNDGDYINALLNIIFAFENIVKLPKNKKAKEFSRILREYLKLDIVGDWANEFYVIRGLIAHGKGKFLWPNYHLDREPIKQDEKTIYWKHPEGEYYYLHHLFLAVEVFKIIFDNKYYNIVPDSEYVKSLFTVNEVIYRKIADLIVKDVPFGQDYYKLISTLKQNDYTVNKDNLRTIIRFIIDYVKNSDLGLANLLEMLSNESEYSPKYNLIIYKIGTEITTIREERYGNVYDDISYKLFMMAQFINKLHYTLSSNFHFIS